MPVVADLDAQFLDAVGAFSCGDAPIVLAVSGGSDSTALMHLAAATLPHHQFHVVSVNHGLRKQAAAEIGQVAAQAKALGLPHQGLTWEWNKTGNLQAAARDGRWACLEGAAKALGASQIWTGHTQDDQIETALMRLARGSGVDGLTGMYPQSRRAGFVVGRPLLGLTRTALRAWLQARGINWSDDPSNDDPRFARVRARKMLGQLQDLGLTEKRLLQTIDHMQAAQVSLQIAARDFAKEHVRQDVGDLILERTVLEIEKADAPRRVLTAALGWIGGQTYRPRFEQLRQAAKQALDQRTTTLGGVLWVPEAGGRTRLTREAAATTPGSSDAADRDQQGLNWDGRWYLEGPVEPGLTVRALGEAIKHCPDWRDVGLPRQSLLASPAVMRGDTLVAAPVAGANHGWSARIVADFHSTAFAIED